MPTTLPEKKETFDPWHLLPMPWAIWFWKQAKKIVVLVVGVTMILLGVAMLVFPGPGWLTIFGGLAVLATEFAWAKWMLRIAKDRVAELVEAAKRQISPRNGTAHFTEPAESDRAGTPCEKPHRSDPNIVNHPV